MSTVIIFLDIDGVLNKNDGLRSANHIDKDMVSILNRIIDSTGAKVVISSTWRCSMSQDLIQNHLNSFGFTGNIIGMTDDNDKSRFNQISDWMDDNGADDFIILDDTGVMDHLIHLAPFKRIADKHFFQIDGMVGLTDDIADKIINRLNGL